MAKISGLRAVATSALVDLSDVVLNFIVALISGSTVMLAQALQGLSDLVTSSLLLLGVSQSRREADKRYQFGYGREIFFWVLISGMLMFLGTGAYSVYLGYKQVSDPAEVSNTYLALAMLVFGFITNSYAFLVSLKRNNQVRAKKSWWRHLTSSSIVETKATFLTNFLGSVSAALGILAIGLTILTSSAIFDGLGSIAVGIIMMIGSFTLIRDVRSLIVGKAVDEETTSKIVAAAESVKEVKRVLDLRTMYLGSEKMLAIIEVHLQDDLTTDQIEKITDRVKKVIYTEIPAMHRVQVELETPDQELT